MAHQMPPNVEDSEWTEVLYFLVPPFWSYLFITMCYIKQTCLAFRSWLFSVGKFCHCKALSLFMQRTYKWCIHRVKSWICIVSTLQSPAACFINSYKFIGLKKISVPPLENMSEKSCCFSRVEKNEKHLLPSCRKPRRGQPPSNMQQCSVCALPWSALVSLLGSCSGLGQECGNWDLFWATGMSNRKTCTCLRVSKVIRANSFSL